MGETHEAAAILRRAARGGEVRGRGPRANGGSCGCARFGSFDGSEPRRQRESRVYEGNARLYTCKEAPPTATLRRPSYRAFRGDKAAGIENMVGQPPRVPRPQHRETVENFASPHPSTRIRTSLSAHHPASTIISPPQRCRTACKLKGHIRPRPDAIVLVDKDEVEDKAKQLLAKRMQANGNK